MSSSHLKTIDSHFSFGANWNQYSRLVDETRIADAAADLRRLLGMEALTGRSFLDIGCGSGLHSLAALRIGAARVLAVDLDPDSVRTTRALLARFAEPCCCEVAERSVFDLPSAGLGTFDVVYSWGVLHHSGAMWEAIDAAARMVAPSGTLALALYRKTPLCGFWRAEKRLYKSAPPVVQSAIGAAYSGVVAALRAIRGKPAKRPDRGMDDRTDLHDWLGGYPYESVRPAELVRFLEARGFMLRQDFVRPAPTFLDRLVIGCDAWRFQRDAPGQRLSPDPSPSASAH